VTYAEKSADPVAARFASADSRACQTAPLCPMKVPILWMIRINVHMKVLFGVKAYQSPVMPSRSIGLLSINQISAGNIFTTAAVTFTSRY